MTDALRQPWLPTTSTSKRHLGAREIPARLLNAPDAEDGVGTGANGATQAQEKQSMRSVRGLLVAFAASIRTTSPPGQRKGVSMFRPTQSGRAALSAALLAAALLGITARTVAAHPGPLPDCRVYADVFKQDSYAKGSGLTDCKKRYPFISVDTTLSRDRWYGRQYLDTDHSEGRNVAQMLSVSRWNCARAGRYTYYVSARSKVVNVPGDNHYGGRSASERFSC